MGGGVLESFQPIFGKVEGVTESDMPLHSFIFLVYAADGTRLRIQVSDFQTSNTWETIQTIHQLEDLRDDVGVGGSLNEFVDYIVTSLSSSNVKLVLGSPMKSDGRYDASFAKLTAQKAKGMPRISFSLAKLVETSASDVMRNISFELFEVYKRKSDAVVKEQGRCCHLTSLLCAEQAKSQKLQSDLDAILPSSKRKIPKLTPTELSRELKSVTPKNLLGNLDTKSIQPSQDAVDLKCGSFTQIAPGTAQPQHSAPSKTRKKVIPQH
ncbi:hypothetical protein AMTR_s00054p00101510, partial [Amborella trichopoda]